MGTELGNGLFHCIAMSGDDWTQWPSSVTQKCCESLESLNKDDCLCASWLYTIRIKGYDFEDTKLLLKISDEACLAPVKCFAPPPPPNPQTPPNTPNPPNPPKPSLPTAPVPPLHEPPPPGPTPAAPPFDAQRPPTVDDPNSPPFQPFVPPTPSLPGMSPSYEGNATAMPEESPATDPSAGSVHEYLLGMQITMILDEALWDPSLLVSSIGEEDSREWSSFASALLEGIASLSPDPSISTADMTVINATNDGSATVIAWISFPVRRLTDAEQWQLIPPPQLRQQLQSAGMEGIQWAGLSSLTISEALTTADNEGMLPDEEPTTAFAASLGVSAAVIMAATAVDVVRSAASWRSRGRPGGPNLLELLLPPLAVSSLVTFVWYTARNLANGPASMALLLVSVSSIAVSLVFNTLGTITMLRMMFPVWRDAYPDAAWNDKCAPGSTHDGVGGEMSRQSENLHHTRFLSKTQNVIVAAAAAVANVGCLKLLADSCSPAKAIRPSWGDVRIHLSVLGLISSLLGEVARIVVVAADQKTMPAAAGWSALTVAAVVLPGKVIIVSAISVVWSLMAKRGSGYVAASATSSPLDISLAPSPCQSSCSTPTALGESCDDAESCDDTRPLPDGCHVAGTCAPAISCSCPAEECLRYLHQLFCVLFLAVGFVVCRCQASKQGRLLTL